MEHILSLLSSQTPTNLVFHVEQTEFYVSLFIVSIKLSSTHSITLLYYFGISSGEILLKISYYAFKINSLH